MITSMLKTCRFYEAFLWAYLAIDFGTQPLNDRYFGFNLALCIVCSFFCILVLSDRAVRLTLLITRRIRHKKDGKPFKDPYTNDYVIYAEGKWHHAPVDRIAKLYLSVINVPDLEHEDRFRAALEIIMEDPEARWTEKIPVALYTQWERDFMRSLSDELIKESKPRAVAGGV